MNKFVLFCTMIVLISSCHTTKQNVPQLPPTVLNNSDSLLVETINETVFTPVDVALDIPKQSASTVTAADSSHLETDIAESDAWINNDGTLGHSIKNKEGKLKGQTYVPMTTKENNRAIIKVKEIPVPQPYPVEVERKLTIQEQIKLAAFWYLVGAVIVSTCYIFRKSFLTVFRKIIRL